jgi:hypothetical protein
MAERSPTSQVIGFEERVSTDDGEGLRFLRERAPHSEGAAWPH